VLAEHGRRRGQHGKFGVYDLHKLSLQSGILAISGIRRGGML
jgi:hypothetical protein